LLRFFLFIPGYIDSQKLVLLGLLKNYYSNADTFRLYSGLLENYYSNVDHLGFICFQMYVTPPDTDVYAIPKVIAPMPQKVSPHLAQIDGFRLWYFPIVII